MSARAVVVIWVVLIVASCVASLLGPERHRVYLHGVWTGLTIAFALTHLASFGGEP